MHDHIPRDDPMYDGDERYIEVGRSGLEVVRSSLSLAGVDPSRILDMPCGWGRVLRHLVRAFPRAQFTACDIDRAGVDYCRDTFGVSAIYAPEDIGAIALPSEFDTIWCGSLFTHIDLVATQVLFGFLVKHLAPGGILVFTTHGRPVERLYSTDTSYRIFEDDGRFGDVLRSYRETGFGFAPYERNGRYGVTLSQPSWVLSMVERHDGIRILGYREAAWDRIQDAITVQRVAS